MTWKLNLDSFSKAVVYFADGNSRTFYSLDWTHKYSKYRDRELGLTRLRKLAHNYGSKAKVVVIYDTASNQEIERYNEGIKQDS